MSTWIVQEFMMKKTKHLHLLYLTRFLVFLDAILEKLHAKSERHTLSNSMSNGQLWEFMTRKNIWLLNITWERQTALPNPIFVLQVPFCWDPFAWKNALLHIMRKSMELMVNVFSHAKKDQSSMKMKWFAHVQLWIWRQMEVIRKISKSVKDNGKRRFMDVTVPLLVSFMTGSTV